MKAPVRLVLVVGLLMFVVSMAFPIDVASDYDHHVDFSKYKTYSWIKVETPNSIWDERVKDAVDKELTAKGWSKVPSGGDVSIAALGTTHDKPTLHTFYDGFGDWYWTGFGTATTTVENYKVGTLIVDMFDSQTKRLIWRGSASDVLAEKPDKNVKKLEKAVHKMLEHFPPKSEEKK